MYESCLINLRHEGQTTSTMAPVSWWVWGTLMLLITLPCEQVQGKLVGGPLEGGSRGRKATLRCCDDRNRAGNLCSPPLLTQVKEAPCRQVQCCVFRRACAWHPNMVALTCWCAPIVAVVGADAHKYCIIGAGPGGLQLAWNLHLAGVDDVAIFERNAGKPPCLRCTGTLPCAIARAVHGQPPMLADAHRITQRQGHTVRGGWSLMKHGFRIMHFYFDQEAV